MLRTTDKRIRRLLELDGPMKVWVTALVLARLLDNCPPPLPGREPPR